MTRFEPSLRLSRLVVLKGGKSVYDERFHLGVNIIRGNNSTGKSTLADMIFYALGGESISWREEAGSCDFVTAEVYINGNPLTLRREISKQKTRSMSIFWGSYEEASRNSDLGWELYPYAQREDRQSFSQVLFTALGIPQVRGELASRVTMHQLLRLVYSDQRTQFDQIFRSDYFDNRIIRDAVGSLLCGFYDEKLYDAEIQLKNITTQYDNISGQLNQLYRFLGTQDIGLELFDNTLSQRVQERNGLYEKIKNLRSEQVIAAQPNNELARQASDVEAQLRETGGEIVRHERQLEEIDFEISDSDQFINALEGKSESLEDSLLTRETLGEIHFENCPACHQPVPPPNEASHCHLCKAERPPTPRDSQFLRLQQELLLQVSESRKLQEQRIARRAQIANQIPTLYAKRAELQLRQADLASPVTSAPQELIIHDIYRRIGYLDREIEDVQKRMQMAQTIRELDEQKAQVAAEISRLKSDIEGRQSRRETRESEVKSEISKATAELLRKDLDREQTFRQVESVRFSFADNAIEVNGRSNFSASSMVVVKNSFHLALLLASVRKAYFRYFRFALFDNIEDKGMEEARSRNFQKLIVEASRSTDVEHQIIFTTSMIAPELDTKEFVVGDFYTAENKSLKMAPRS